MQPQISAPQCQRFINRKVFEAAVEEVYSALTQAETFAKFTGKPADISADAGGEFSRIDLVVSGRHIKLAPVERIVRAWRVGTWPDDVISVARFEFNSTDSGTQVVLDHAGYPDDAHDHLDRGWSQ